MLVGEYSLFFLAGFALVLIALTAILVYFYCRFKQLLNTLEDVTHQIVNFRHTNPLTGLPDRIQFFDNLNKIIAQAKIKKEKIALLFLDIDNFRGIKDSLGYAFGDALLESTAKRLISFMDNRKELLAKIGSDQFAIILEYGQDEKKIYEITDKILQIITEPLSLLNHELTISAAIGISTYPTDGEDAEQLLKNAGIAKFQAKKTGSNAYSFYTNELNIQLLKQQDILEHLRKAVNNGELVVYYQPKVCVKTRKIVGAEALMHWNSPELGTISPAQFIPLAEQSGVIVPIGNLVLKEACAQAKKWHKQGFPSFSMAINLSAYQFRIGDIAERIAVTIWETGLDPATLEIEITESMMMENIEKSLLMLKVLTAMGVQLSIDDFGTGYSSLSQLKQFPVNCLKIDQSFVKSIHDFNQTSSDNAILTTIITMAKQLKLKIIAEGVETEEQFDFLKKQGCDLIQGYLFSKPIPADQFTQLLIADGKTP